MHLRWDLCILLGAIKWWLGFAAGWTQPDSPSCCKRPLLPCRLITAVGMVDGRAMQLDNGAMRLVGKRPR